MSTTVEPRVVVAGRPDRAAHDPDRVEIPETLNLDRDRVRWGAILAGVAVSITNLLLLTLLGAALGLTAWSPGSAAESGPLPGPVARNAALWAGLAAVLAFFLGGAVAGRTAAVFDRGWGALNGALVFMVGLPLLLWLAASGVGSLLGIVGEYAGTLGLDPSRVANAAQAAPSPTASILGTAAQRTAWSILGGLLLALGAAALGGAAATRRELKRRAATGELRE